MFKYQNNNLTRGYVSKFHDVLYNEGQFLHPGNIKRRRKNLFAINAGLRTAM